MSVIPGTVVGGAIVPSDTADTYPVTDPQWGKGGLRTVLTTTARNAIPVPRLEKGMLVHVTADGNYYELKDTWDGVSSTVDADWQLFAGSTSSAGTGSPVTMVRYVDSVNGSDSNDGLAPGVGRAWLTIAHALSEQPIFGNGTYEVHLANGTYGQIFFKDILGNSRDPSYGNNVVKFIGDTVTPSNVVIQDATNPVVITNGRSVLVLDGMTLDGNVTSNGGVLCFNGVFDLLNVNVQNCIIGVQMNEASRGRWLSSSAGGVVTVSGTGFSLARGASFSLQRSITVTGFSGFAISASSNAVFGMTTGITFNANGTAATGGIQAASGAMISSSASILNISGITDTGNGLPLRAINGGRILLNDGMTINLTGCTRGGQVASSSYFQDGAFGNTWNYIGGTAAEWLIDSDANIYAPGTFSGAVVKASNQAGYILGTFWTKQGSITADFTLNSQIQSLKVNGSGPINVTVPTSASVGIGRTYLITDISGNAATNNITLTMSGGDLINGASTFVMNTNYGTAIIESITGGWCVI